MRIHRLLRTVSTIVLTIACSSGFAWAQGAAGVPRAAPGRKVGRLPRSSGEYLGRKWHIDENHLMWWDGKPYVRFGFTGNGNPAQMLDAGFDQFALCPAEDWPISGPDPRIVRSVRGTSDRFEKARATYYGGLKTLWPWRPGGSDKAPAFLRDVRDVTEHAGRRSALDVEVRLPIPAADETPVKAGRVKAILFDLDHDTRLELSAHVESVAAAGSVSEAGHEAADERRGGRAFRVRLGPVAFPASGSLRLVIAVEHGLAEVPGARGLPPLWKPGIRQFYRSSLKAFRPSYARAGLRGLEFGDEINTVPISLLTARTYLDIRRDSEALGAYRKWLARRFGSIERLNRHLRSNHASFDRVHWVVPLHPFDPKLARTDKDVEREESWTGGKTAWGLAATVDQLRTISQVQDEFRQWFCGHWLAEYARFAKEVIGPVPVFVCSAGISGDANQYLAMHRWALREGVDGLIRNHYGNGGKEDRRTLASLARWFADVQQECGRTKHLWANEVGYVRPDVTDAEWAAAEAADRGARDSFGSQWAFPSQERLRDMLVLLNQYGYRGFNRFLMNPSSPRAAREVEWMARLRPEMVALVVKTKGSPSGAARPTRDQATAIARRDRRVAQLLRGAAAVRVTAEYSDRWNVWLVTFLSGDRRIAFASVSDDGEVLEVGSPRTDEHPVEDRN